MNNKLYFLIFCVLLNGIGAIAQNNPPKLAWKFNTKQAIFSSPVADSEQVYFGGLDSTFYALDLQSGKLRWKIKTQGSIRSTAGIYQDKIYFISGDGKLYCISKLGKVLWTFATLGEKQYDFADYFQSSPVFDDNVVFFGSGDSHIYALNTQDGSLKWKYKTEGIVHTKPAIDEQRLYVGSFDGYVYALSLKDGQMIWKFKTVGHTYFPKGEVQGSPALNNRLVFIGARDYNVYAIDKAKGYCHWNKSHTRGWVLSQTIQDSVLFMAGADERILVAVEPESGQEYWKNKMEFLVFGNAIFDTQTMYVGTTIGKLHAINRKSGEKIWTYSTEGYQKNRLKYFKEGDSYRDDIYSIIKSNEHFLEVECELGGIFSTPVLVSSYIIFTSSEGNLYCLKIK
jgi:eukaryotic-like serine/threonine-protein kinase